MHPLLKLLCEKSMKRILIELAITTATAKLVEKGIEYAFERWKSREPKETK